jgi:4-hydroxythreonine-4-phosphate dehydrogenase
MSAPSFSFCLTLGDPNGLGPELAARHFAECPARDEAVLLIGPAEPLAASAASAGIPPFWTEVDDPAAALERGPGVFLFCPPPVRGQAWTPGRATPQGGLAAGLALEAALPLLRSGAARSLVTAPLNKAMLQEAGFDFPGHTEFLAERSGVGRENICMHLAGPRLRVSLVTTHPPLSAVPALVTGERILRCLELTCDFTRRLGLSAPVAVCGLNPHAGEEGRIGREEIETIAPAVRKAQDAGLPVLGPWPADTLFRRAADGEFSAVLAMYHDQGLAPLKTLHFNEAVNVTLGLPFIRTSVDHGTGYDLVGTGRAHLGSLRQAMDLARRLAAPRES